MICGHRECIVSEVNLRIACRNSAPSRAATAFRDPFNVRRSNQYSTKSKRIACSTFCSLYRMRCSSSIVQNMFLIGHGNQKCTVLLQGLPEQYQSGCLSLQERWQRSEGLAVQVQNQNLRAVLRAWPDMVGKAAINYRVSPRSGKHSVAKQMRNQLGGGCHVNL